MLTFRRRKLTRRIILHDSRTLPDRRAYDIMLAKGREMGLLEVGYHTVIERCGGFTLCRPYDTIGSHTPGHNHDSIGLCLASIDGDYTEDQLFILSRLVWELHNTYGPIPLLGHYEVQRFRNRPQCPAIDMRDLRQNLGLPRDYPKPDPKPEPSVSSSA